MNKGKLLKICVLGAESTGTTTLSIALAKHFKTCWVPEFGRFYSEAKLYSTNYSKWQSEEFAFIASQQTELENILSLKAQKYLICDTNAFATRVWHKRYMGFISKKLEEDVNFLVPDLYVLTGDEIPFVQDGTRDGEKIRHQMHKEFIRQLQRQTVPFLVVRGSVEVRLESVLRRLENLP